MAHIGTLRPHWPDPFPVSPDTDHANEDLTPEEVRAFVRSPRIQEKLRRMVEHADETPGESLARGLRMSMEAARERDED